jgi:hypothetical protein
MSPSVATPRSRHARWSAALAATLALTVGTPSGLTAAAPADGAAPMRAVASVPPATLPGSVTRHG